MAPSVLCILRPRQGLDSLLSPDCWIVGPRRRRWPISSCHGTPFPNLIYTFNRFYGIPAFDNTKLIYIYLPMKGHISYANKNKVMIINESRKKFRPWSEVREKNKLRMSLSQSNPWVNPHLGRYKSIRTKVPTCT